MEGICKACRLAFSWDRPPMLRDARCPKCGSPLRRTSHVVTLPFRWVPEKPAVAVK